MKKNAPESLSPGVRNRKLWVPLAGLLIAILLPHLLPQYYVHLMNLFLIGSLFALSFNILLGNTGLLSFGHGAYFGLGAYGVALLMQKAGVHYFLAIPLSLLITGAIAAVIGYFCSRVVAMSFAILTLAFGELLFTIASKWYTFTGGDDGIQSVFPPGIIASSARFYYFTLIIVALASLAIWRILHSPFGYTLQCIRDNRQRIESIGINVRRYQWMAFIISGIFAGLAGSLFVTLNWTVAPTDIGWVKGGEPLVMTIVGGQYVFGGPIIGAAILTFFQFFVGQLTLYWALVIGIVLALVVRFLPGGVGGYIQEKLAFRRQNHSSGV
ncbi:MAG: branched-chain amino acid ABC transporter permease [Deltaproteobacteria bacterium]|nr:branched-chain amino acid ABC transporter permease [Deltaproteobacteria bacterium]